MKSISTSHASVADFSIAQRHKPFGGKVLAKTIHRIGTSILSLSTAGIQHAGEP